jgi:hypothetical protein
MDDKLPRSTVEHLAAVLEREEWKTAVLLRDLNVDLDEQTGGFNPLKLWERLQSAVQPRPTFPDSQRTAFMATVRSLRQGYDDALNVAQEGKADEINAVRTALIEFFKKLGLVYEGCDFVRGALLLFRQEDGIETRILTYVGTKLNRFGQVSFSVNHLFDPTVHWVVLVAKPFSKMYLYRREELARDVKDPEKSLSITIRAGTSDANLLEKRIEELVNRKREGV